MVPYSLQSSVESFLAFDSGYTPTTPTWLILQVFDARSSIHTCDIVILYLYLGTHHHYQLVPSCLSMVYINELWSDSFYHVIDFKYFIHMVYIHTFTEFGLKTLAMVACLCWHKMWDRGSLFSLPTKGTKMANSKNGWMEFISMHWLSETLYSIYTHFTEPCLQHPSDRLYSIHRLSSELASSPSSAFFGVEVDWLRQAG